MRIFKEMKFYRPTPPYTHHHHPFLSADNHPWAVLLVIHILYLIARLHSYYTEEQGITGVFLNLKGYFCFSYVCVCVCLHGEVPVGVCAHLGGVEDRTPWGVVAQAPSTVLF